MLGPAGCQGVQVSSVGGTRSSPATSGSSSSSSSRGGHRRFGAAHRRRTAAVRLLPELRMGTDSSPALSTTEAGWRGIALPLLGTRPSRPTPTGSSPVPPRTDVAGAAPSGARPCSGPGFGAQPRRLCLDVARASPAGVRPRHTIPWRISDVLDLGGSRLAGSKAGGSTASRGCRKSPRRALAGVRPPWRSSSPLVK
jgi:hypothetical protein